MKNLLSIILIFTAMGCTQQATFTYPETAKGDVVDNYHGTEIADPYRWLEDDMSDETAAWVKAQNEVTFSYLESIPFRDALKERMTQIWNYPKMGTPFKEGDLYFYSYNTGLQNQSIIYMKKNLDDEGEVFLDPNSFSEDGTVALAGLSISNDHKYAAYGISKGGSDWREFFVKEIETGRDLDDHLEWIKFSGMSWFRDGFFYTRYEQPEEGDELKAANLNARVFYHKVGTPQSEDRLIYQDPDHPEWGFNLGVTEDESYFFLGVTESTSGNALAFKKAALDDAPFTWIDEDFDDDYTPIGNHEDMLYVLTNNEAPLYRLVGIDLNNPDRENWVDVIPEQGNVLESARLAGGKIIATYIQDAKNAAYVYDLDGSLLHEVSLPGIGSLGGFSGKMKDNTAFYSFTSFNYPATTFKYNIAENKSELFYTPEVDFDAKAYETKQVFYTSKDGTEVPMFIVYKKGLELDGNNPTLLYGYGGFNISLTPSFNITQAVWLEQGGVFALANLRGGGEYGEEWHKAGTLLQKQNVFDDFIAAAEYLIEENYTSSKRLGIYGASNGGCFQRWIVDWCSYQPET
jgi:prolyl oligopeptidase